MKLNFVKICIFQNFFLDAASHNFRTSFSHYDVYGDIFDTIHQYARDNGETYNLGRYSHMTGSQIFLTGGTWCGPVSRGRKTTGTFYEIIISFLNNFKSLTETQTIH